MRAVLVIAGSQQHDWPTLSPVRDTLFGLESPVALEILKIVAPY